MSGKEQEIQKLRTIVSRVGQNNSISKTTKHDFIAGFGKSIQECFGIIDKVDDQKRITFRDCKTHSNASSIKSYTNE